MPRLLVTLSHHGPAPDGDEHALHPTACPRRAREDRPRRRTGLRPWRAASRGDPGRHRRAASRCRSGRARPIGAPWGCPGGRLGPAEDDQWGRSAAREALAAWWAAASPRGRGAAVGFRNRGRRGPAGVAPRRARRSAEPDLGWAASSWPCPSRGAPLGGAGATVMIVSHSQSAGGHAQRPALRPGWVGARRRGKRSWSPYRDSASRQSSSGWRGIEGRLDPLQLSAHLIVRAARCRPRFAPVDLLAARRRGSIARHARPRGTDGDTDAGLLVRARRQRGRLRPLSAGEPHALRPGGALGRNLSPRRFSAEPSSGRGRLAAAPSQPMDFRWAR